uniref:Ribosomal protein S4 n=1 Tax=Rhexinema sarcinoideum TaxID=43261 RepID=A0A1B2RYW8_9CHLO|nr:ribosomal protein S4 [Rhexinema sarcinoideum]
MHFSRKTTFNCFPITFSLENNLLFFLNKGFLQKSKLKKIKSPLHKFFRLCSTAAFAFGKSFSKPLKPLPYSFIKLKAYNAADPSANKSVFDPLLCGQAKLKAKYLQNLVLLAKIKKKSNKMLLNFSDKNQSQTLKFNAFCKKLYSFNHFFKQQFNLKPFSTITGFKKFMVNSVKVSQNQLQPGYNRRKHCHSHYNQILKEKSHLSKIYGFLSKTHTSTFSAFTLNLTFSSKFDHIYKCQRPIPKLVSFLENRFDVVLWRNLQSESVFSAKQKLRNGIYLNGGLQKKSSTPTFPGDVFFLP